MGRPTLPGDAKDDGSEIFVLEKWGSLNTKANRTAIPDNDFSYIKNFLQIGDGNLRTLYAEGSNLYTTTGGKTVLTMYPFNLSSTKYIAVFLSDGSAIQVRVSDGATTTMGAAATFSDGVIIPSCAQHGADNIIIVSKFSSNGYWIWDGTSLFGAGTLSWDVVVTNGGRNYTSTPTVTAYGGSGSGATFSATVSNQQVTKITATNPGSGYKLNEYPVLAISGGGSDDGAALTVTVDTTIGGVESVQVTNPGTGYTSASVVSFSGGGGTGAAAVITAASDGAIYGITVINSGTGYTSAPTISVSVGAGFTATVTIRRGQVTAITAAAGGTGYDVPPVITIVGDGSGATAVASLTAGVVTSVAIVYQGIGYTWAKAILSDGNDAATAEVNIMPFGVSGSTVETYQQRVWVGDGDKYLFTAPESLEVFSAASGGGAVPINDSFTRYTVTKFIQNNFLYRLCDSSVNVISNVQTAGVPPITSFNDQNVDPQVGTSWPDTVQAFGRATMFANPTGVYALFGGAAEKVSEQLDGLFANASFNTNTSGVTPTACVFDLFSIKVYGILFTTKDPYSGSTVNILAIWDGKKWTLGDQLKTLKLVATQEIDSQIVAWGTDGTHVFPLFQTKSSSLTKIAQTKLSVLNSVNWDKQVNRFYVVGESKDGASTVFNTAIDNEEAQGSFHTGTAMTGLKLYGYDPSTYGKFIGVTVTTTATDASLVSMTGLYSPHYAPNA